MMRNCVFLHNLFTYFYFENYELNKAYFFRNNLN